MTMIVAHYIATIACAVGAQAGSLHEGEDRLTFLEIVLLGSTAMFCITLVTLGILFVRSNRGSR